MVENKLLLEFESNVEQGITLTTYAKRCLYELFESNVEQGITLTKFFVCFSKVSFESNVEQKFLVNGG